MIRKEVTILVILLTAQLFASNIMGETKSLSDLFPKEMLNWTSNEADQIYDPVTLYNYIDGAAELFLSYGFQKALTRRYTRSDEPTITLDIFEMKSSRDAYGVFTHSMETVEMDYGQGSQFTPGLLIFWKNRYYVSIMAVPETEESKKAVDQLARSVENAISEDGSLPDILRLVPEQSLIPESIRYFHHHVWLNTFYFISDKNLLQITDDTDALLAKYGKGKKRYLLLLVRYKNRDLSRKAYDNFVNGYLPELYKTPILKTKKGTWISCRLTGDLIIVLFEAPDKGAAAELIRNVEVRL